MKTINKYQLINVLIPIICGVLIGISWQSEYLFPIHFFLFAPIFYVLDQIKQEHSSLSLKFTKLFLTFFLFKSFEIYTGTNWLVKSTLEAMLITVLVDSIILTFISAIIFKRNINFDVIVFVFIFHELLIQNISFLSPLYMLGFSLGGRIEIIQYYSLIGVEGGSLLLYLANYSVFKIYKDKKIGIFFFSIFGLILILTTYSIFRFYKIEKEYTFSNKKVSIIHCENDFSNQKYIKRPETIVDEIASIADTNSLIIAPEGTFVTLCFKEDLHQYPTTKYIDSIAIKNKQSFLFGANILSKINNSNSQSKYDSNSGQHYNIHTTSLLFGQNNLVYKSKQKFIPFHEYVPSNFIAQYINKWIPIVGDNRKISPLDNDSNLEFTYKNLSFQSFLCYESLFPLHIASETKNKDFITILTNESWHENKLGKYSFLNVNAVLAIQSGIPIYRSSNHGVSAVIKPNGVYRECFNQNKKFTALKVNLPEISESTLYNKIHSYTYWISILIIIILIFKKNEKVSGCFFRQFVNIVD